MRSAIAVAPCATMVEMVDTAELVVRTTPSQSTCQAAKRLLGSKDRSQSTQTVEIFDSAVSKISTLPSLRGYAFRSQEVPSWTGASAPSARRARCVAVIKAPASSAESRRGLAR